MRILIPTIGCDAGRSGIGQYACHLIRGLAASTAAHTVDVVCAKEERGVFLQGKALTPDQAAYVPRHPLASVAWCQVGLPAIAKRRRYDVVFLPAANRRAPLWMPCPTVGTVHDFSSIHMAGKYDPARHFYITRVLPLLARRLTRVIAVSNCTKDDIVTFAGVPPERIHVIHHGVEHDVYNSSDEARGVEQLCEKYSIRRPYLLYIARIEHPGKNHVRLINAFDRLKATQRIPHQLVLVGSDWTRADAVHAAAERASAREDIVFTGYAPDSDLPDLYRGAELFIFPSLYEGFGMPLLEAMACGTPVCCSGVSSLPEVAGDAATYFDPLDDADMAAQIGKLLASAGERGQLREAGFRRSAQFTWKAAAERTLEVLCEAAATAAPHLG